MKKSATPDAAILLCLRAAGEPVVAREIMRRLGLPPREARPLRLALRRLADAGTIVRLSDGWVPAGAEAGIEGRLEITRAGHGYLIPDDASRDDLYIPAERIGAALHGDRVRVRLEKPRGRDFRHYGAVTEVLERGSPRIVAEIAPEGLARPEDPRNRYDYEIEGDTPPKAHTKILLEVTRWPGDPAGPAGRILETLGPAGAPDTETAAILATHGAPGPFPAEVKREVHAFRPGLTENERAVRLDCTKLTTFTIDPADARDFDDALSLELLADGTRRVGVHIADVSHYVRPGSALDEEARDRSTSIYLPERVIPMLPEELSNDLCSLRPREIRPTMSVFLRYAPDGKQLGASIHRSFIRSDRRFTYEEVRDLLKEGAAPPADAPHTHPPLLGLHQLARALRAARLENGSIELELAEHRIVLDDEGRAIGMAKVEHDESHQLVEEFMLAANAAVADWCVRNALPVLHRIHEPPADDNVGDLANFLTASGYPFRKPLRRDRLNQVLRRVRGRPEEHSIHLAVLKSFKQAVYGPDGTIGHFALNFPRYLHFTSPIRRYPDTQLHQALAAALDGRPDLPAKLRKVPAPAWKELLHLGQHASQRERRAMKIEEEVKDFRRLEFLSRQQERIFTAVVTGIRKFGIFVEIENYFVEGLIPRAQVEALGLSTREETPGAIRRALPGGRREAPGFHLGQEVRIRITRIDLPARRCEMELLSPEKKR